MKKRNDNKGLSVALAKLSLAFGLFALAFALIALKFWIVLSVLSSTVRAVAGHCDVEYSFENYVHSTLLCPVEDRD